MTNTKVAQKLRVAFTKIGEVIRSLKAPFGRERVKRVGAEVVWVVLGQCLVAVGGLVGVKVLTDMMVPEQYGKLATGMTVAIFLQLVFSAPISAGLSRFYPVAREQKNIRGFLVVVRSLFSKALIVLIIIAIPSLLTVLLSTNTEWFFLCLSAIIWGMISMLVLSVTEIHMAARQRKEAAIQQGINTWGRFTIAAILMTLFGATSTVAMIGYVLSAAGVLIIQRVFFFNRLFPKEANIVAVSNKSYFIQGKEKQIWRYSWPFVVFGIFSWLHSSSDRWALGYFVGMEEVGLYMALYQIGYYPIHLICSIAGQVLAPVFFGMAGDASDKERMAGVYAVNARVVYLVFLCVIVCFLLGFFVHPIIFKLFIASNYWKVSSLFPWMVLAGGLTACGHLAHLSIISGSTSNILIFPRVLTSLLFVACNCLGAFYAGIEGVVAANVIFGVSYFAWMVLLSGSERKNIGKQ
ncbi:MAG: lipopolysaccharide biosynthesis protein [Deltaproteobacteria bacterium]|nr:lipopolysaccharide biosynthesis protein [Deltaproteobacteria bacterium]